MTASAKAERDIVQAKLGQSIRRLDGLTRENQIVVTLRNAQQLYDEALRQHIIFCNKKGEDPFAGAHLEWQNALEDNFGRSCIEAEEKLEALRVANEPPDIPNSVKLASAKTEWAVAECQIKLDIEGLIKALEPAQIGAESHKSLEAGRDSLVKDLDALKTLGAKIVQLAVQSRVPDEEVTELMNSYEELRKSIAPKIAQINSTLIMKKPDAVAVAQTEQNVARPNTNSTGGENRVAEPRKQFIKYQPQEMPKFSGKAKDYARWKKLWQEGISPQFAESAQMMAFQTCLPETVWKKIGRLTNISRVWEELDRHYGAPKIVTAEILNELEQFKSNSRSREDFLPTFTIMLEDAARLLDAIDRGDRIKSEQQVDRWLSALPEEEQDRYFMVEESLQGSDWEKLMKFLSGRKKAVQEKLIHREYVSNASGGNKSELVCSYPKCNKKGHTIENCRSYKADQGRLSRSDSSGRIRKECYTCGQEGHLRKDCTAAERDSKRSPNYFSSHYLTTSSCKEKGMCKRIAKRDEKCPGCQQLI